MANSASKSQGTNASRPLVFMLALAIFIHALDRGNFGTASPLIKDDLALSNTQIGILLSAFFWSYVPGHVFAGWLCERIDAYRTLALGLVIWSVATLLTGFAGGFATLLALRLLLGIGESAGFPASSKLLALHLPPERLAAANGLIGAGLCLGNGMGVLFGGLLLAALGWQALFFLFGGLSLLWLIPWARVAREARQIEPVQVADGGPGHEPGFAAMLSRREMWGAMIGQFCSNYPYFIVLSWLPLYLVKQQGYSIAAMAWIGGTVYVLAALFNLLGGWLADRWIASGASINRVRKTTVIASSLIGMACMLACALGSPDFAVAGLLLFSLSNGLGAFSIFSIGQTLAGPRVAGKWMGLQNGAGGIAGMVGPLLTGILIDLTGDYRVAFLFAAGVALLGVFAWGVLIPKVRVVDWSKC